jgi:UMF1 family MFS transporter
MGYAGGLVSITAALVLFVQTDAPFLSLDKSTAEHVRIVGPMTAVWLLVFALPLFLWTPDRPPRVAGLGLQIRNGLAEIGRTFREVRSHANVVRFLIARMLYADGLTTVFVFGGIYAAGAFGMELAEVLLFGIVLNLTAGAGAFIFGWVDDYLGPKRTILFALTGLFVTATGTLVVTSETGFWIFGSALGVFVGPAQASSRSFLSRLAPPAQRTEFFGLYSLTGKATAFLGPALVAALTAITQSQRWGLSVLLLFFAAGGALLLTVREPEPVANFNAESDGFR